MEYISLFSIFIFTIFATLFEYRTYRTIFTPFILFAIPYVVVIIMQVVWIFFNKTAPISYIYLSYVLIFLVLMFVVGNTMIFLLDKFFYVKSYSFSKSYIIPRLKLIEYVSIFSAIYLLIYFIGEATKLDIIGKVVQEDFQDKYSGGINFYLRLISMIGAVYFIAISQKRKTILLAILCLMPNFLTFVKGMTIIPITAGLVSNLIIYKKSIGLKTILYGVFFALLSFSFIYLIEISIWNPDKLFKFKTYIIIFNKISTYLISGVQSFNINSENIGNIPNIHNPVYAPFVNILYKFGIFDYRINTIGVFKTVIVENKILGTIDTNVNTYIGTILLYSGIFIGIFVHLFITLIVYTLFYISKKSNNLLDIMLYSIFSTGFILAWFDYYYMQTFWIYILLYFTLLRSLYSIKKNLLKMRSV